MRAWRICRRPFADLTGEGAKKFGGRWNSIGHAMVYMAETAALAVLEVRVHLGIEWALIPEDYVLVQIETDEARIEDLKAMPADSVAFGNLWLRSRRSVLLRVPSIIVPESANILLNPNHADASGVKIVDMRSFAFDRRLWTVP